MQDFYSAWLKQSESIEKTVADAPRVAKGKNLNWMRTRQDSKAALMIAPELGFPTGGSLLMRAEIPPGWHTGKEPVSYLSGLAWPLEASVYMGRMEQIEDAGPNDLAALAKAPGEESQYWPTDGRRIAMHEEQFELSGETKHGATYFLMGRNGKQNGFKATAAAISSIFVDLPHSKSHSHAHPEAYLYALQGSGYSEIGGKRHEWDQGDAVHVPPGMMHHQHFNPNDTDMKELRFEFGIRYWLADQWKGYTTIDRHMKATHMDD